MDKIKLSIVFLLLLFSSCVEPYSSTTVIITNPTSHDLKMVPYSLGIVVSDKITILKTGESIEIEQIVSRGKTREPLYFDPWFKSLDSIQIIWDDDYMVTHLMDYYEIDDSTKIVTGYNIRNIARTQDYERVKSERRNAVNWQLKYTFTESDYEFAKEP